MTKERQQFDTATGIFQSIKDTLFKTGRRKFSDWTIVAVTTVRAFDVICESFDACNQNYAYLGVSFASKVIVLLCPEIWLNEPLSCWQEICSKLVTEFSRTSIFPNFVAINPSFSVLSVFRVDQEKTLNLSFCDTVNDWSQLCQSFGSKLNISEMVEAFALERLCPGCSEETTVLAQSCGHHVCLDCQNKHSACPAVVFGFDKEGYESEFECFTVFETAAEFEAKQGLLFFFPPI